MPRREIDELRMAGKLEEAYLLAQKGYEAYPESPVACEDLVWTTDALLKREASAGNLQQFLLYWLPISILDLSKIRKIEEVICWRFRALLASLQKNNPEEKWAGLAACVFSHLKDFRLPAPCEATSVLCKAFYRMRERWSGFCQFMDWWGWDRFRPEDYKCETLSNGKKMPISLVEGCHLAYAKHLLAAGNKTDMKQFCERLESLATTHPEMLYPEYYVGKMLIACGNEGKNALTAVLPFARKKKSEFWVWKLLADTVADQPELYMACLLRAAHSKTKPEFLVKIYYTLVSHLMARKDFVGARFFLAKYAKVKMVRKENVPWDVAHWMEEPWFTAPVSGESPYLKMDFKTMTNQMLYDDIPAQIAVVVHVNKEKGVATVIHGYEKRGFFKYKGIINDIKAGHCAKLRIDEQNSDKHFLNVLEAKMLPDDEITETDFIRLRTGMATENAKQTAMFLRYGYHECAFIPPQLCDGIDPDSNMMYDAWTYRDYNHQKESWSWCCLTLQSS